MEVCTKIDNGIPVTYKEIKESDLDLIPEKLITYDGKHYFKESMFRLTKDFTSRNVDGKWVAKMGMEYYHNIREYMETNKIDQLHYASASKENKLVADGEPLDFENFSPENYSDEHPKLKGY